MYVGALIVGMGALVLVAGCSSAVPGSRTVSTATSPAPAPFSMPATELVVPYELIPQIDDTTQASKAAIKMAFGSMLESVSVKEAFLGTYDDGGGKQMGFRIEYRLVDCETPVVTYDASLNNTGIVPPISQLDNTPPARDAMPPERFRVLLRAYGKATRLPFGALESYRTAMDNAVEDVDPSGLTRAFGGQPRALDDLWVITPGAANQADYLRLRNQYETPGYVFEFPKAGAPTYLGRVDDLGEAAPLGD